MFRKIMIRAPRTPWAAPSAEKSIKLMGTNQGNLLYINSVYRALHTRGQKITSGGYLMHRSPDLDGWAKKTSREQDAFVMPLANAFRLSYGDTLVKMTEAIRKLTIPTIVVGVGAQAAPEQVAEAAAGNISMGRVGKKRGRSDEDVEKHNTVVFDFVSAVLEKSATIGVRGEITKAYLTGIGISPEQVTVIGCPSLFTWGSTATVEKGVPELTEHSRISLNFDYRVPGMPEVIDANVHRYPNLTSVVQDTRTARMLMSKQDEFDMNRLDTRLPIYRDHPLVASGRVRYYPSPWQWIESFRDQEFAFGSRLHGTIAALLSGIPGHLLAHDTRTLELAQYHAIPHSMLADYDAPPLAEELFARSDFTEFNRRQPELFKHYLDFLHVNGLKTSFDFGRNAKAFDRKVKGMRAQKPVHALH